MDKTNGLGLVSGVLWGWLALSLIMPFGALALSPALFALVLAAAVLIFRVSGRADAAYVGIGVLIGALVTVLVPTLSPVAFQDGSKLAQAVVAGVTILLSYHV